jgi:3-dehydroquinate synthase/shikimate kinase/3-dehydroquinate synthase
VIVLVGFMGAGKSTVGRALAARLGLPFVDSDREIERAAGRTVREIFAADGEPAFRELERTTIAALLDGPDGALALGGGAVEDPRTRELLAGVPVVFLAVDLAQALARTGSDGRRPVLRRPDLPELFERRQAGYREVATVTVVPGGRSVEAVVEAVLEEFAVLLRSVDGAG